MSTTHTENKTQCFHTNLTVVYHKSTLLSIKFILKQIIYHLYKSHLLALCICPIPCKSANHAHPFGGFSLTVTHFPVY